MATTISILGTGVCGFCLGNRRTPCSGPPSAGPLKISLFSLSISHFRSFCHSLGVSSTTPRELQTREDLQRETKRAKMGAEAEKKREILRSHPSSHPSGTTTFGAPTLRSPPCTHKAQHTHTTHTHNTPTQHIHTTHTHKKIGPRRTWPE